jgi:cytochrome c oxidase assembly protein subunit 15
MRRFRLSPAAYRKITLVAAILLGVIIVTGGAVRLTGSGLGCPDWPQCRPGSLVPRGASDGHAMVEFLNRTFTGAVSIAVIVCVLGSLLREPRRRDLIWPSVGLVAGVVAQAVLGGLTVLFDLRPEFVMAHFLLSLVLLTDAIVLYRRAGDPHTKAELIVEPRVRALGRVMVVMAAVVVVTGTIVTSTGPHGGDRKAKRFAFELQTVARVHGVGVMVFLGLVLVTLALLRRTRAPEAVITRLSAVLLVACIQGAIGYIQYFNDIPALLVGFHIAGATALWSAVCWYYLGLFARPAEATAGDAERATPGPSELQPA